MSVDDFLWILITESVVHSFQLSVLLLYQFFLFEMFRFDNNRPGSSGVGVVLSQMRNMLKCDTVDGFSGVFDHEILDCFFGFICG